MVYILDTHPLVWYLEGSRLLPPRVKTLLLNDTSLKVVPSIVLAEMVYLYARNRIATDAHRALRFIQSSRNCLIYPLDENVIEKLTPDLDIHDGIICATACVYRDDLGQNVAVITKDRMIAARGLIPVIWQ
jgi:PIN domain nuclease of toxin-antitoxin system